MAKKKKTTDEKSRTKSGHKSLRIRKRVQFAIEFWATFEGKSDTAFIESACKAFADLLAKKHQMPWRRFFHENEGVRLLNVFQQPDYPLSDDHDRLRTFVMNHRDFFYFAEDDNGKTRSPHTGDADSNERLRPNIPNVETLWPQIQTYAQMKGEDYWSSGRAMAEALKGNGLTPPAWPPKRTSK